MAKVVNGLSLSKEDIKKLSDSLNASNNSIYSKIDYVVIPHGHLSKTHDSITQCLNHFDQNNFPDIVLTLATSHYEPKNIFIDNGIMLESGVIKSDSSRTILLKQSLSIFDIKYDSNYEIAQAEHSWRIFLNAFKIKADYLNKHLEHISFLLGDEKTNLENLVQLIQNFITYSSKRILLVISGDFTHYGTNYKYDLFPNLNGNSLLEKINEFDKSAINKFIKADFEGLKAAIDESSFCAKNQLLAIEHFNFNSPEIIHYEQYSLNDYQTFDKNKDNMFSGFSLISGVKSNEKKINSKIKLISTDNKIYLHDLRNNNFVQLNFLEFKILDLLIKNNLCLDELNIEDLNNEIKIKNLEKQVQRIFQKIEDNGWLNHSDKNTNVLRYDMESRLNSYVENNLIYSEKNKKFLENNILESDYLRDHWEKLGGDKEYDKKMYYRLTSGSSGKEPLLTKYPKSVLLHRNSASHFDLVDNETLIKYPKINFNRKDNLNTFDEKFDYKYDDALNVHKFALDNNPYMIEDAKWFEIYDLTKKNKQYALYSDPHFLYAFLNYCKKENLEVKPSFVNLTHSYCWSFMLSAFKDFFKCNIVNNLKSSELISITKQCPLGTMHLDDANIHFELEPFHNTDFYKLIASTLDTEYRPLIRYYSGDLVKKIDCKCHLDSQAVEYIGREKDLIFHKENIITLKDINDCIPTGFSLKQFYILYENELLNFSYDLRIEAEKSAFEQELKSSLLSKFDIEVSFHSISNSPITSGKYLAFKVVNK